MFRSTIFINLTAALITLLLFSFGAHLQAVYTEDDLLVTFSVPFEETVLVEASRAWRHGVRAHLLVDGHVDVTTLGEVGKHFNESYTPLVHFPSNPSVVRQVLAPLFAFHAVGGDSFKWLLLGDADTIFNVRGVVRLINSLGLSAEEPHMLSDFLLRCTPCTKPPCGALCQAAVPVDPRCQPCSEGVRYCACNLTESCSKVVADRPSFEEEGSAGHAGCPVNDSISAYGGAGIIYSVGHLRKLLEDPRYFVPTAFKFTQRNRPYSDLVFAELSRGIGYGFTVLPPRDSGTKDAAINRYFGPFSPWNDNRRVEKQLQDLRDLRRQAPERFNDVLSYHLRIHNDHRNLAAILPAYLEASQFVSEE